jgi:hypothetical protein
MGNWTSKSALMIAIGTFLAVGGVVLALLPFTLPAWVGIPIALSVGALALYWIWTDYRSRLDRRARRRADGFSEGASVEVDCRLCGQFNRVPAARLRDRPICGRCKTRLMPGKRVVLCRTSPIAGSLRGELNALWSDEDRLWGCLADHLVLKRRADEDRRRSVVT